MFGKDTAAVEAEYMSAERLIGLDGASLKDFRHLGHWMREAGDKLGRKR